MPPKFPLIFHYMAEPQKHSKLEKDTIFMLQGYKKGAPILLWVHYGKYLSFSSVKSPIVNKYINF